MLQFGQKGSWCACHQEDKVLKNKHFFNCSEAGWNLLCICSHEHRNYTVYIKWMLLIPRCRWWQQDSCRHCSLQCPRSDLGYQPAASIPALCQVSRDRAIVGSVIVRSLQLGQWVSYPRGLGRCCPVVVVGFRWPGGPTKPARGPPAAAQRYEETAWCHLFCPTRGEIWLGVNR